MTNHVEQAVRAMSPRGKDAPQHSTGRAPRNESRAFKEQVRRECRQPRRSPSGERGPIGKGTPGKQLKSAWRRDGKPGSLREYAEGSSLGTAWFAPKKDGGAEARKLRHAKAQAGRKPKSSSGPKPKKEKKAQKEK